MSCQCRRDSRSALQRRTSPYRHRTATWRPSYTAVGDLRCCGRAATRRLVAVSRANHSTASGCSVAGRLRQLNCGWSRPAMRGRAAALRSGCDAAASCSVTGRLRLGASQVLMSMLLIICVAAAAEGFPLVNSFATAEHASAGRGEGKGIGRGGASERKREAALRAEARGNTRKPEREGRPERGHKPRDR